MGGSIGTQKLSYWTWSLASLLSDGTQSLQKLAKKKPSVSSRISIMFTSIRTASAALDPVPPCARGTRRRYHRIPPHLRHRLSVTAVTRQKETPLRALFSRASQSQMKVGWAWKREHPLKGRGDFTSRLWQAQHTAVLSALILPRMAPMRWARSGMRRTRWQQRRGCSFTACHTFKGRPRQAAAVCRQPEKQLRWDSIPLGLEQLRTADSR